MCQKAKNWCKEARTRIDTNAKSLSLDAYLSLYRSYFGGDDFKDKEEEEEEEEEEMRKKEEEEEEEKRKKKRVALEVFRQCLIIVEKGFCHVHDIGNENPESLDLHGSILASVLKNMISSDEQDAKDVYRAQIQVAKIQSWMILGCFSVM
jgi:hypothetical protein